MAGRPPRPSFCSTTSAADSSAKDGSPTTIKLFFVSAARSFAGTSCNLGSARCPEPSFTGRRCRRGQRSRVIDNPPDRCGQSTKEPERNGYYCEFVASVDGEQLERQHDGENVSGSAGLRSCRST